MSKDEIEIPIGKIGKIIGKKLEKARKNPYAILSLVLAIAIAYLPYTGSNFQATIPSENSVSAEVAGQNVIDFAAQQGAEATIVGTRDDGQFYEVTLSIEGEEVPVYVTKDGKNLIPSLVPLNA